MPDTSVNMIIYCTAIALGGHRLFSVTKSSSMSELLPVSLAVNLDRKHLLLYNCKIEDVTGDFWGVTTILETPLFLVVIKSFFGEIFALPHASSYRSSSSGNTVTITKTQTYSIGLSWRLRARLMEIVYTMVTTVASRVSKGCQQNRIALGNVYIEYWRLFGEFGSICSVTSLKDSRIKKGIQEGFCYIWVTWKWNRDWSCLHNLQLKAKHNFKAVYTPNKSESDARHSEGNHLKVSIFYVWQKKIHDLYRYSRWIAHTGSSWKQVKTCKRNCSSQQGSGFEPPPMLVGTWSASVWIKKARLPCWPLQSAGVAPEMNLRMTTDEKAHKQGIRPCIKTQGRHHQMSKIGVSVVPKKDLCPSKIFKRKKRGCSMQPIFLALLSIIFVQINLPGACYDQTRDKQDPVY